jgi:uncharacterized protein (TIGR02145 family)
MAKYSILFPFCFLNIFFIQISAQENHSQTVENYTTTKIGNAIWATSNLAVSKFRNGDIIPQAKNKEDWKRASIDQTPIWSYYNFDSVKYAQYGKLYNWYAVSDSRGITPSGFHIPSVEEWDGLISTIREMPNDNNVGQQLKTKMGWSSGGGENKLNFNGFPLGIGGGMSGDFFWFGEKCFFWSSSDTSFGNVVSEQAWCFNLAFFNDELNQLLQHKSMGLLIRCVKD